jgi:hypothetical protein
LKAAVDSSNGAYIRRILKEKISRARVLVCLIGGGTAGSPWVTWEIRAAKELGKGLVGVLLKPGNRKPTAITDSGAVFVAYGQAEIERAIEWAADAGKTSGDFSYDH